MISFSKFFSAKVVGFFSYDKQKIQPLFEISVDGGEEYNAMREFKHKLAQEFGRPTDNKVVYALAGEDGRGLLYLWFHDMTLHVGTRLQQEVHYRLKDRISGVLYGRYVTREAANESLAVERQYGDDPEIVEVPGTYCPPKSTGREGR